LRFIRKIEIEREPHGTELGMLTLLDVLEIWKKILSKVTKKVKDPGCQKRLQVRLQLLYRLDRLDQTSNRLLLKIFELNNPVSDKEKI